MENTVITRIPVTVINEITAHLNLVKGSIKSLEKSVGSILIEANKQKQQPVIKFAHDVFETLFPHHFSLNRLPEIVSHWSKDGENYLVPPKDMHTLGGYFTKLKDSTRKPEDSIYYTDKFPEGKLRIARWDERNNLYCILKRLVDDDPYSSYGIEEGVDNIVSNVSDLATYAFEAHRLFSTYVRLYEQEYKHWTEETVEGQAYKAELSALFAKKLAELKAKR